VSEEEAHDKHIEAVFNEMMLPVKHNIAMMRSVATTKKQERAIDTLEWFFSLGPGPEPTLWDRISILPWAILDKLFMFKCWILRRDPNEM